MSLLQAQLLNKQAVPPTARHSIRREAKLPLRAEHSSSGLRVIGSSPYRAERQSVLKARGAGSIASLSPVRPMRGSAMSKSVWKNKDGKTVRRNQIATQFAWQAIEMLESPAYRS